MPMMKIYCVEIFIDINFYDKTFLIYSKNLVVVDHKNVPRAQIISQFWRVKKCNVNCDLPIEQQQ